MRILITGVAGFIGSHLAGRLVTDGHSVVGIDNLSAGVMENVHPKVDFQFEDICSSAIYPLFDGADTVFHLAAKNCLLDCLQDPVITAEINVKGTANVLEAVRRAGVRKVVYADTSAEYEGVSELPSRVERIAPLSVYARSKHAGAMFCEAYERFHGLRLTIVRYFNVYGPAQDWRRSIPPLMSAFAIKMLRRERPTIYGTGEKRRDFVYIGDVTNFNVLALQDARTDGHVYNVGSGVNHTVNEIFCEVEALLHTGLSPVYKDDLPGEATATLAHLEDELRLGWRPRVGLREGIAASIEYVRQKVVA
jgi:UDP-glucose 4-epimerase